MKNLITMLILILSFNLTAQNDWAFETDKQLHFGTFTALSYGYTDLKLADNSYTTFDYFASTQMLTMFAGMAKEGIDFSFRTGHFSWHDIAYNQLGSLTGTALKLGIEKYKENKVIKRQKLKL